MSVIEADEKCKVCGKELYCSHAVPELLFCLTCNTSIQWSEKIMKKYITNPKTKGSGILAAIPQRGTCPNNCDDCFFQSGRSFLEPLKDNLPNLPSPEEAKGRVIRMNDGNDSNVKRDIVENAAGLYDDVFFNTSIPKDLESFPGPVVLTINPGYMTDFSFHGLDKIPKNLMFVRIRTSTWNIERVVDPAIRYYTEKFKVPVVLTFMSYFDTPVPDGWRDDYVFRKRTLNSYNAITTKAWRNVMDRYKDNILVYSCGKIEGEKGDTHCTRCGNCIREYFNAKERLRNGS